MVKIKHLKIIIVVAALLAIAAPQIKAYELPVHGYITNEAYKKSILADVEFNKHLGIENRFDPFGDTYVDVLGEEVREWTSSSFERSENRMPDNARPLSIEGWLMRGAIREDDFVTGFKFGCWVNAPNPQGADPYPAPPDRSLNHFFDPVLNDRPLTGFGIPQGQAAFPIAAVHHSNWHGCFRPTADLRIC